MRVCRPEICGPELDVLVAGAQEDVCDLLGRGGRGDAEHVYVAGVREEEAVAAVEEGCSFGVDGAAGAEERGS